MSRDCSKNTERMLCGEGMKLSAILKNKKSSSVCDGGEARYHGREPLLAEARTRETFMLAHEGEGVSYEDTARLRYKK